MSLRTGHDILCVGFAVVLDKTESIHKLNFNNVPTTVFLEKIFNLLLASCRKVSIGIKKKGLR